MAYDLACLNGVCSDGVLFCAMLVCKFVLVQVFVTPPSTIAPVFAFYTPHVHG